MLRFVFRLIGLILITSILITGIAIWKGGEPFRWVGKKTEAIGRGIIDFGEAIDRLKGKKKKVEKAYRDLKEIIRDEEDDKGRRSE